jgi:NAD-dependent DNA ligase
MVGQVVIFTGFRDAALKKQIEERGGRVKDNYSSDVTLVIANDLKEKSTKLVYARNAGKKIVSRKDFR